MSKRLTDRENLLHKLQQMTDNEVEDVLDYVSLLERAKQRHGEGRVLRDHKTSQHIPASDDELLAMLSTAYENRRACQVFEWEAIRRKSEVRIGNYAR
ncbi:MAG: hypothetical protein SF097_21090 [Acidobacteriota bacterium]|nr:hypothetical protein [Acidobacteriota bacterium]